jgi:replicative DNA helicase
MSDNGQRDISKSVFAPQQVSQQAVKVVETRAATKGDGIETGIAELDKYLVPMRPGELVVVLGYTSNYKSGLMNFITRHHAKRIKAAGEADKKVVMTFTWEQSVEEQGIVDISQIIQIPTDKMMRGELSDSEWKELHRGAVERGALPWWLVGHSIESKERRPRLSMADVYAAMAHVVDVQKVKPVLVALDYLQRMPLENSRRDHRIQFMEMVDAAKDLALAFHVPVLLGAQSGRQVQSRTWRLPQKDDGQETSNLEQSADKMISVWMPKNDYPVGQLIEYGNDTFTVTENLLICGLLKQKFGPAPKVMGLHVKPQVNEIYSLDRRPEPNAQRPSNGNGAYR